MKIKFALCVYLSLLSAKTVNQIAKM